MVSFCETSATAPQLRGFHVETPTGATAQTPRGSAGAACSTRRRQTRALRGYLKGKQRLLACAWMLTCAADASSYTTGGGAANGG